MMLDINLDEPAPAPVAYRSAAPRSAAAAPPPAAPASAPLDQVEQRLAFAAWPQARVHDSWLQALAQASGVAVSAAWGPGAGPAARAVADALLVEAGAAPGSAVQRLAIDRLPAWALQDAEGLHRQLSTAGALNLLPELRAAVRGDVIRQWDAVLGTDIRRNTVRWCVQNLKVDAPPHARALRSQAQAAARSADGWQAFCQGMALAALAELGPAVQARMRLAWPHAQRQVAALALDPAATRWLQTCLKVAGVMLADLASRDPADELAHPTPGPASPLAPPRPGFLPTRPLGLPS